MGTPQGTQADDPSAGSNHVFTSRKGTFVMGSLVLPGAIALAFGRRPITSAGVSLPRNTTGYDFARETPAGPRIGTLDT